MEHHGHIEKIDHVSIDMHDHDLVSSIEDKMEKISLLHSIGRVSDETVAQDEEKYHPNLVSIGPFHHGKHNLNAMEDHKWEYFTTLLNRNPHAGRVLHTCVNTLRRFEQKARMFYGERVDMESDKFVEVMLVDGCFMIELFLEFSIKNLRRRDDPIFFNTGNKIFRLRCDMILLENQIPFWVLQQLFNVVVVPKQCNNMSLMELALCYFRKLIPGDGQLPYDKFGPQVHNLLDLIRHHYLPTIIQRRSGGGQKHLHGGATFLQQAGITLRRAAREIPSNITFINGELEIPPLQIHGYTETLFRNLIAFELCHHQRSKTITSYVIFMSTLIQAKDDVQLLHRKKILVNSHDEREGEIVNMFTKLRVEINVTDFYYGDIYRQINEYKSSRIQRSRLGQKMKDIYDGTNVGVVGFIIAIVFLVFCFAALFFAIVTYLLHHFQ